MSRSLIHPATVLLSKWGRLWCQWVVRSVIATDVLQNTVAPAATGSVFKGITFCQLRLLILQSRTSSSWWAIAGSEPRVDIVIHITEPGGAPAICLRPWPLEHRAHGHDILIWWHHPQICIRQHSLCNLKYLNMWFIAGGYYSNHLLPGALKKLTPWL